MAVDALLKKQDDAESDARKRTAADGVDELELALLMARADVNVRTAEFELAKREAMGAFYQGNLVDLIWSGQGPSGECEADEHEYDSGESYEEEEEIEEEEVDE